MGKWVLLSIPGYVLGCRDSAPFHLVFCAFLEYLGNLSRAGGRAPALAQLSGGPGAVQWKQPKTWAVSPCVCL